MNDDQSHSDTRVRVSLTKTAAQKAYNSQAQGLLCFLCNRVFEFDGIEFLNSRIIPLAVRTIL
jgi:hypothetical protein